MNDTEKAVLQANVRTAEVMIPRIYGGAVFTFDMEKEEGAVTFPNAVEEERFFKPSMGAELLVLFGLMAVRDEEKTAENGIIVPIRLYPRQRD